MKHSRYDLGKGVAGESSQRCRAWTKTAVLGLVATIAFAAQIVQAQTVKIQSRPLTPQERKSYTNTIPSIQLAGDNQNVGIGQPLYLEALVTKGTVVTQVNWNLVSAPAGSLAVLTNNPVTNNTYDVGDQNSYDVTGRKLLVPDVACAAGADYKVSVDIYLTNTTISVTNSFYGSTYRGIEDFLCQACHSSKMAPFGETAHATAFQRKICGSDGSGFKSSCVSCHTLGYDTNSVATNGGFDDVWVQTGWVFPTNLAQTNMIMSPAGWSTWTNLIVTNMAATNWDAVPATLQSKANIQCENCHGPADRHVLGGGDTNAISISLSAGNCGQCHDSKNSHIKNYQWSQTLHATGYVFRTSGSCAGCHSAKGFIDRMDSDYASKDPRATGNEGITCAACHDPHNTGSGESQLRPVASVTLSNNVVIAQGGEGLLCMSCHHDRYNANDRVLTLSGPHYGVQSDMLAGENAIEYGMTMPSSRHLSVVTNSCVECHMQETSTNSLAKNNVGEHTFTSRWNAGTPDDESDDVLLTETCAECHGEIEDFNFGGEDYDQDGVIEGVQEEIEGLMYQLAVMLPPYTGTNVVTNGLSTSTADYSKRAGAYNWNFVKKDGSKGVHNAKYAAAILRASIDDLKGGIDVDHDGLLDSWEISKFGDIASESGSDDADGDGASNAIEMAAGTNPNVQDSDSDGLLDYVELQGGSNPLDALSTAESNAVTIVPAVELGYLPQTMGVTQQFQAVDTLIGTWTNIGPSFVGSNTCSYQLWSIRDPRQKFFRVITTP